MYRSPAAKKKLQESRIRIEVNDEMSNQLVTRCPCCGVELAVWLSFGEPWQQNAGHDTVPDGGMQYQAVREDSARDRERERWCRQFWADVDDAFRALGRPPTAAESYARHAIQRGADMIWELSAPDAAPSFAEWCVEVRCHPGLLPQPRYVGPKNVGYILAAYDAWAAWREQGRQGGAAGDQPTAGEPEI